MNSVCFIVQNDYDHDPRVRRKAEALIAAGYLVDVLALRDTPGKKSYTLNGANVRTMSLGKKRGGRARYFFEYAVFFSWAFYRVSRQMLSKRYTVIDVNTLPDFLVFAPVLARWMGAKLILDMHEITPEFYMSKYRIGENSNTVRVLKWLEQISMNFADRVITINEPVEDLLVGRGLPRSKSTVIMNTVDEDRFAVGLKQSVKPVSRNFDKIVMMYHGTLTEIYGLDVAIEAFAQAHDKMPGAELWILGSGPEKKALAQLAEVRGVASKVNFVGQVCANEIPAWLSQCDIGVLPIRCDVFLDFAFPNKLPEFIIMGKAVIVSRLKAIREYFSENALAYFEPNDPAALAEQMARVYGDRQLRSRLALQAKEEYEPIRWEVMKQRYLSLIADVTGDGRGCIPPDSQTTHATTEVH